MTTRIRFILTILLFNSCTLIAQNVSVSLSKENINEILLNIDTISGNRNYHVLLKAVDEKTFFMKVYINDRLGGTMFEKLGVNICRFYKLKKSKVFVYELKKCKCNIPHKFMQRESSDPYAHLTESPFFVENGFVKNLLVELDGKSMVYTDLEYVKEDIFQQYEELLLK